MEAAIAEADDGVFAVIEYSLLRYGVRSSRLNDLTSLNSNCPEMIFIDTRHPMYTQEHIDYLRANCNKINIVALDAMHGFITHDATPDVALNKPFTAQELAQLIEQILATY